MKHRLMSAIAVAALATLCACGMPDDPASRIERAKEHQLNAEFRLSMLELKNALQDDPDNVEARITLGEVLLALGQPEAAEKELQRAAGLGAAESRIRVPIGDALLMQGTYDAVLSRFTVSEDDTAEDKYEIHQLRGRAHLALGDGAQAISEFDRALENNPDSARAMLGLAAVSTINGDTDTAAQLIERALASEAGLVEAWLAKGQLNLQAKEYTLARENFEAALARARITTERELGLVGLTEAQIGQNKLDEASRSIEMLVDVSPDNLMARYLRGRIAAATGDYKAAEDELQQVLWEFPTHLPSKLMLGIVSYAQSNLATAESYLTSALDADPGNLEARKLLAQIRMRLDQPEDALNALNPVMEQGNVDTATLAIAGQAKLVLGEFDAGIVYLEQALGSDPKNQDLRIQLAATYLLANRQRQALDMLAALPESAEGLARRELLLFLAQLQSGDMQQAQSHAEKLIADSPANADLNYLLGSAYVLAGAPNTAQTYFEKTLQINEDYVAAVVNLARLEASAGRLDDAGTRLEQFLEKNPEDVLVMLAMAQVAELRGDGPAILGWLQRAIELDARAPAARLMLARYYVVTADFQRAEELAQALVQSTPDDAAVLQILGLAQLGRGHHQQARLNLRKAVRLRPNSVETHYGLAISQLTLNDAAGAAQSLERIVELKPDDMRAIALLAGLMVRSGELERAEELIENMLALDADSYLPHTLRGDVLTARGDHVGAARAYGAAAQAGNSRSLTVRLFNARQRAGDQDPTTLLNEWLSKFPEDQGVRLLLAQAYQTAGRNTEAKHQYGLLLDQSESNVVALNNLAWLRHLQGDSEAVELAAKAHEIQPQSGAVADTYGWILVQTGEVEKGVTVLREAAKNEPDIGEIRYHLAAALAGSGEEDEALQLLTELLDSGAPFESRPEAELLLNSL